MNYSSIVPDRFLNIFIKIFISTGLILILSGFGTQAQVAGWTDYQICKATIIHPDFMTSAGDQEVFNQLKIRNLDCSVYMPSIMNEKARKDAADQKDAHDRISTNGCIDYFGQTICAPPGGSAQKDFSGQVVCGPGQCVMDSANQIRCSGLEGGAASLNYGQAVCVGGCVYARAAYCQRPTR